jgi:hypothetical protein
LTGAGTQCYEAQYQQSPGLAPTVVITCQ